MSKEIVLLGRYLNAADERLALPCDRFNLDPAEQSSLKGARGDIQTSVMRGATLRVYGLQTIAIKSLGWKPTHISFLDDDQEEVRTVELGNIDVDSEPARFTLKSLG